MFSKLYSAALVGLDAQPIQVEVDLSSGIHAFSIVGLADKVVNESKERVSSAIKNSGFSPPQHSRRRVVVNLAPAELKKQGPAYDLPIALAFLKAIGNIEIEAPQKKLFIGELSLEGDIRKVNGILPIALMAREKGYETVFVPQANAEEAAMIKELEVIPLKKLSEVIAYFKGEQEIKRASPKAIPHIENREEIADMKHIKGQDSAKMAMEIAACGMHNIIMHGPPGAGKTLLARTLPSILSPLSEEEVFEVTKIFSVADCLPEKEPLIKHRPFRTPHHSASAISLIGGGSHIKPGEVTLAHRGVLFLDEFPEFPRALLESLRQPLEDGLITISRASGTITFPAKFILVGAMNPCPCGNLEDEHKECTCTPSQVARYQQRVSGPLLDRIDLHIQVPRVKTEELTGEDKGESSAEIRKRVVLAQKIQEKRFKKETSLSYNGEMMPVHIKKYCLLTKEAEQLLRQVSQKLRLSARSYYRILKLARTAADMDESEIINHGHMSRVLGFRPENT